MSYFYTFLAGFVGGGVVVYLFAAKVIADAKAVVDAVTKKL
jgi:hypothetical protein